MVDDLILVLPGKEICEKLDYVTKHSSMQVLIVFAENMKPEDRD